jgi:hypothetical protein
MKSYCITVLLVIFGLILLGIGSALHIIEQYDVAGASIDDPVRDVAELLVGSKHAVSFDFHNPTRHTVHVVGLGEN